VFGRTAEATQWELGPITHRLDFLNRPFLHQKRVVYVGIVRTLDYYS